MGMGGFPAERTKKSQAISGPRIAGRKITDMRLFLSTVVSSLITNRDFFWGELLSNYRYRIELPEELIPLQRQICGNFSRKSLITDTNSLLNFNYFLLQIQTSGSKRIKSARTSHGSSTPL